MKKHTYLSMSLAAGAFLLTGTLAVAQTAPATKTVQPSDSAGNQPAGMAVDHQGGNGVRRIAGEHAGNGQNPLYESKDKANLKTNTGASTAQPYKDPEDMTTRYRPGNNKTTRSNSGASASGTAVDGQRKTVENPVGEMKTADKSLNSSHATESVQKKHVANVKYNDRTAAADNGRTPKVDSFPVKQ